MIVQGVCVYTRIPFHLQVFLLLSASEEGYAACARSGRGKNKLVLDVALSVLSGKFGTV